MKKPTVAELVILILACTIAFVLCTSAIGMLISKTPANEFSAPIRQKLIDLLNTISGAIIGVVVMMLKPKNDQP